MTSEGFHQFDVEANFSTDDWNTLVITYDGSNMSFYNNTTLLHSEPIQGTVVNSDYDLTIGVLPHDDISSYGAFFEGNIDHFHIWNKALDANDILNQTHNSHIYMYLNFLYHQSNKQHHFFYIYDHWILNISYLSQ